MHRRSAAYTSILACLLASCSAPSGKLEPQAAIPSSPAASPAGAAAPFVTPAPPPNLPPAPTLAPDARARLSGSVLLNGAPVTDANLTAIDLATGRTIALQQWAPKASARRLLNTLRTDDRGAFDLELPPLTVGQVVKLVATRGSQTFTALFNDRGQALGGPTPSSASYQLQQGQAVAVTIQLRLTAATTAACQAFEGVLKLTFQLPADLGRDRQAAILEAARQAAQQVEQALVQQPSVAARLVSSLNAAGETQQLETFRTALTNLALFQPLFRAIQGELLTISNEKLTTREGLAPVFAREFPLDDVVISASGFLGFSGQRNPIVLAGAVTSNFVPTPPRGGGGSQSTPPPSPSLARTARLFPLSENSLYVYGLAYLRGNDEIAIARGESRLTILNPETGSERQVGFGTGIIYSVSQTPSGSETVYVGMAAPAKIYAFEPDPVATSFFRDLAPSGYRILNGVNPGTLVGAGRDYVYGAAQGASFFRHLRSSSMFSGLLSVDNAAPWAISDPTALAIYDPPSGASATLFVGTEQGQIFMAVDRGASRTLWANVGQAVTGLAFASPTLYFSIKDLNQVAAININQLDAWIGLLPNDPQDDVLQHLLSPRGLVIDEQEENLYIATNGASRTIIRYPLPLPTLGPL